MIGSRSGVLTVALFLLLAAGATTSPRTVAAEPRLGPGLDASGEEPEASGVEPAMRILRGREDALFGGGQCPTGIEIELWPPNHKYVEIDLEEVLGSQTTAVEVLSITQDEPVDDVGDGHTECDGDGIGTSVARIRSERSGLGNGRVYEIEYSAFDGACFGFVHVLVPHDRSGDPAEDDGQDFDSTEGCP